MNKLKFDISVYSILLVLLAACHTTDAQTETSTLSTKTPTEIVIESSPTEVAMAAEPTESPSPTPEDPELIHTQLTIDGDPSDWANYEVLINDPKGDHQNGGFDIAATRAFANDQYLYVLIETHEPPTDYVQVDLDIEAGERHFIVSFNPLENSSAFIGEIISNQFNLIGEVAGSSSAAAQATEFKVPLSALGDVVNLTLRDVRPMGGECCGENWYPIDNIESIIVAQVDEVEPASVAEEVPSELEEVPILQVCAADIALPTPFGSLQPAPIQLTEPGYAAEWFVAPGAFNMPLEVLLSPEEDVIILSVREGVLYRLANDGTIIPYVDGLIGPYQGDIDAQGNVYLFDPTQGKLLQINPDGAKRVIAQTQQLLGYGGPVHISSDGNFYIPLDSGISGKYPLFKITPSGGVDLVAEFPNFVIALASTPDGRVVALHGHELSELSLDDYSLTAIAGFPVLESGPFSYSGLAVDDAGNIFVSTGSRERSGTLYRVNAVSEVSVIAEIPENGLSGIEWLPRTNEIIGTQMRYGSLIAVAMDGSLREIVQGNGIITPMDLAFSPCGELAVPNDDGGMMTLIDPSGKVSWFMDYLSFIPPVPYVAFEPDGTMYASEGEPMPESPKRVVVVPLGGVLETFYEADMPSGLAYRSDGTLFVSETGADRITQINPDDTTTTLVEGIKFPSALLLDDDDNLYAITGPDDFVGDEVNATPIGGDTLIQISPEGIITTLIQLSGMTDLASGSDGSIYVAAEKEVIKLSPDGRQFSFASGFERAIGLAFDIAGHLYVSDERTNSIVRIGGFPQGILKGMVTDVSGLPVEGARVQVLSIDPIVVGQIVFTNGEGHFSLPAAPRSYDITVTVDGYETTKLENINAVADQEIVIEIQLEN
jgi:DNA-binding beta-propeller fold protein YncE